MIERAHVVQAIGEFDQKHADIARNGEQELAEVLRLLGLLGDQVEFLDLGEAVDQRSDLAAEQRVDLAACRIGVLDRVMQQRGRDGGVVKAHLGQDRRHFQGMGKVRGAGGTLLIAVRLHGIDIRAVEQGLVRARVIREHPLNKLVLAHHGTPHRPPVADTRTSCEI